MRRNITKNILRGTLLVGLLTTGCKKILDENPRSTFTPEYFKTEQGVTGGLTYLYYHLRNIYGQAYYYNSGVTGTDEATWGQSADGNFKDYDYTSVSNLQSNTFPSSIPWGEAFPAINTASGVIENGTAAGVSAPLLAEARFFRAFDYFLLVQTYGGVPLDLGSGLLKFNINPIRTSKRNTVPEVYTKAIFPDLLQAINDLPATGRVVGGVTKTAARLYLAKAYLTYAWWLQNPKNIPTYPVTNRTDPNGHDATWYFQAAYDLATAAINDPGPFALQPTYYDVNVGSNDRNSEIVLYADHTQTSEKYNGSSLTFGSGGAPDNFASWMLTWNYPNIRTTENLVLREADQHLGRPWVRMAPPIEVFKNTFADKTNDSRYDGTFTTVYRGNWPKGGSTSKTVANANGLPVSPGDAVLTFLNDDNNAVTYAASNGNVGAGVLPNRSDWVVNPSGISRIMYPGIWKLGPYRTDNGTGLGQPNAGSTRPFPIAKFSELYFIAAEAAIKGANTTAGKSARDLINVIRARAGKWRFDNNGNKVKTEDDSQAMLAATPATIDLNYLLAERSREYYGEGGRWYDLIRTQTWSDIAATYTICGPTFGDHNPQKFTRTIQPFHYLRPIPQSTIDSFDMTPAEKAAYQNPGY
ncbi:RagB/SusD family nutrient uptake outer membrane protein [Mucilaginibacter sp. RS28]|uniref:RagB/SusD family nutrient uptake outer membrane protein n=1 Tax=Mucilaginibacter straminoryzae TaxID=2932774 RepID=A0A9X2BBT3_9SPHI|nr:RagB/SusD family nutrient uptake outer membrane protein [Mucilaginibacter straminoryzae]MCJ8208608.1 RagB/SusD family nutrient uptake outer membrane protein [Mucilaginibacter straminoryzae]